MATGTSRADRHPEIVQSPRERRPFAQLAPQTPQARGLTGEAARGLPRLRLRCDPMVPVLVRGLVSLTESIAPAKADGTAHINALNRRRRAATEWLRAILDGGIDPSTLHNVRLVWMPALTGATNHADLLADARTCIEYVRGAMTGLVMCRPEDNLVPDARSLHTLETVLSLHLGALEANPNSPAPVTSRAPTTVGA